MSDLFLQGGVAEIQTVPKITGPDGISSGGDPLQLLTYASVSAVGGVTQYEPDLPRAPSVTCTLAKRDRWPPQTPNRMGWYARGQNYK